MRTDDPETRFAAGSVLATDPADRGPLTVIVSRHTGPVTVLGFEGVTDRGEAEALRNTLLVIDSADLPEAEEDEFYDHQLTGLAVHHVNGTALGTVTDVLHPPASPVLVVAVPDGADVLVPFVKVIVPDVDLVAGRLTVDPPEGMFGPEPD